MGRAQHLNRKKYYPLLLPKKVRLRRFLLPQKEALRKLLRRVATISWAGPEEGESCRGEKSEQGRPRPHEVFLTPRKPHTS